MSENYDLIRTIGQNDAKVLEEKGRTYGDSWRKRGGVGAFMMLSRKWDRIENIAQGAGYDIFKVGADNTGDILDDIADLRRYLLLVEAHVTGGRVDAATTRPLPVCPECRKDVLSDSTVVYRKGECPIHSEEDCGPGPGYVNQDGPVRTLPWREPGATPPEVGPFDVFQVKWGDGTYSTMLPQEFGKIAEWSEVKLYRVLRDGASPNEFPLPKPHRKWDGGFPLPHDSSKCLACGGQHGAGMACLHSTPTSVGSHTHTHSTSRIPLDSSVADNTILAGVASIISGINTAL